MLRRYVKPRAAIRTLRCLGTTALGYAPLQERPAFCGAPVTAVAGAGVFHRTPMLLPPSSLPPSVRALRNRW